MTDIDFTEYSKLIVMHDGVKVAEITQDEINLFDDACIITEESVKS